MEKVCVLAANLGNFDKRIENVEQSIPHNFHRFTDENFPPRSKSMSPRLQARIAKCFGWQIVPGYDVYIWVDSSCILPDPDSIKWFVEKLGDADIAVFKHPNRNSLQEEGDYMKKRLAMGCPYITPRYENECIDEQLAEIKATDYVDDKLFATTALIYRNNEKMHEALKELWYHTSRYHANEQMSAPYVFWKLGCKVNIIPDSYLKVKYLKYVRK